MDSTRSPCGFRDQLDGFGFLSHDLGMARLILIPGLGANRLLFEPQRHYFDQELFLPDWAPPMATEIEGKKPLPETLQDYARRMADRWRQTILSKPENCKAFWIGGVSMGGQIALEAAARLVEDQCPPKGVFLIASTRSSQAVPSSIRFNALILKFLKDPMVKSLNKKFTERLAAREKVSELDQRLMKKIADALDVGHLRWGKNAIAKWQYTENQWRALMKAGVRIHQIHGDQDRVIPLVKGQADKIIRGGGHLINITHKEEVNEYLESRMRSDLAANDDE